MKKLAKRTAIAALAFAVALVLANAAAERWLPVPAQLFRADPELLHVAIPGARRTLSLAREGGGEGGWITTEIDPAGHRGRELAAPKRGARIHVAGDSLVMAETVALEDTFVERLRAELGASDAVNGGVSGYGPDQALLAFEREAAVTKPDLVVLVICAHNDFGDVLRNKLFRVGADGTVVRNTPTLAPELVHDFDDAARKARAPALSRFARRALASTPPAPTQPPPYVEWYLAAAQAAYDDFAVRRSDVVHSLFEDTYDADVAIHPEWPSSQLARVLVRGVLARWIAACGAHDVPLVALVVPSAIDAGTSYEVRVDPRAYPTWSPERLTQTYTALLGELGVPFVDFSAIAREVGAEALFRGPRDFHWSAAGQALAARHVAEFVRARSLWPPARVR